jgi:hypothetical protein
MRAREDRGAHSGVAKSSENCWEPGEVIMRGMRRRRTAGDGSVHP